MEEAIEAYQLYYPQTVNRVDGPNVFLNNWVNIVPLATEPS